jgi:hypothetical protein
MSLLSPDALADRAGHQEGFQVRTWRKIDPKSLAKLKAEAEAIPPQTMPRAAKNLADLKASIQRMERDNEKGN